MMCSQQPFPSISETVAPDPTALWSSELRKPPFVTNVAWLNLVLNKGEQPEYIHPFLVGSKAPGAISICYPARVVQPGFIIQAFVQDMTVCCWEVGDAAAHRVCHFDDTSVTLEVGDRMRVPLVRGSPYVSLMLRGATPHFSSIHAVVGVVCNRDATKHKVSLNNGQVWVIYSSSRLPLSEALISSECFTGVVRISVLAGPESEAVLDRYSSCYPLSGSGDLSVPFQVQYEWKTEGWGELLMLSSPVQREILAEPGEESRISSNLFDSIDGPLQGVVGGRWVMQEKPISVGWYSCKGVTDAEARAQIAGALEQDVAQLSAIQSSSTYFHGKALARAARLAVIAEEVSCFAVVERVRAFLLAAISPWLEGSFAGNGVVYDSKWGGLVSREGAKDAGADFGLAMYNDHHYHWGYFVYAGAVLAKLDPCWGSRFKPHLFALVQDYMSLDGANGLYPRLRNFDLWVLHSWAGGLVEFGDGRNQESTSEAVHAYYAAALLGLAYAEVGLVNTGLTLAALESRASRRLWHIPSSSGGSIYEAPFGGDNKMVGVLWANKRDAGLWFAGADHKECRLGIQLLPICPVTEHLFQDPTFAREVVEWTLPCLDRPDVTDAWKGFVYALQAVYEPQQALSKILSLSSHDDGNSLSNLLWWIHSRCFKMNFNVKST